MKATCRISPMRAQITRESLESAALVELWEFVESADADALTKNDLKCALIVLGEAAQLPEELVHDLAGDRAEVEVMFYIRNKCEGDGHGNV